MKKNLEELIRLLPRADQHSNQIRSSKKTNEFDNVCISNYLKMLCISLKSRVNPFISLLAEKQDGPRISNQ